jgi:mannose-6-phosphate isomerase-like protein (cupin superfamily)
MPEGQIFYPLKIIATLPDTAATMLTDVRLTDEEAASCRVFRVHRPVPAHFHVSCDEYLHVLTGRAEIVIGDDPPQQVGPGELIFFRKRTVHALPRILEHPFTVLAIDTPRRPAEDVHFIDPGDGTPESFIHTQS